MMTLKDYQDYADCIRNLDIPLSSRKALMDALEIRWQKALEITQWQNMAKLIPVP